MLECRIAGLSDAGAARGAADFRLCGAGMVKSPFHIAAPMLQWGRMDAADLQPPPIGARADEQGGPK